MLFMCIPSYPWKKFEKLKIYDIKKKKKTQFLHSASQRGHFHFPP